MARVPEDSKWKPIPFFPDYWISSYSDIFNLRLGVIMAQTVSTNRMHYVQMSQYGKRKTLNVHELFIAAFPIEKELGNYGPARHDGYFDH